MTNAIGDLKGRLSFFLGVNTGFVADGLPDERFLEFYTRRSSPKLHCAIVGNVVVPGGFGSNAATPRLTSAPVWRALSSAIAARGTRPGIQLASTWENYVGSRKFVSASSRDVIANGRQMASELTRDQQSALLESFDAGAALAVEQGFTHIQFHAAHGYLLSLLVDSRINPQADFVLDRLAGLSERLAGKDIESSIRISLKTGDAAFDDEGSIRFHAAIACLPFTYVDLSSGFYNIDKRLIYPSRPEILEARFSDSVSVARRFSDRDFIVSGRMLDHDWKALPPNVHLGVCRDMIANPDIFQNPANGCKSHGKCHYYSRGEPHLTCARWEKETMELTSEP